MPSKPTDFREGDVVFDVDNKQTLGIITKVDNRGVTLVWEDGGRSAGPGLLRVLEHHEPRITVVVPTGVLGNRGWNREQAIRAALRRVGLRP